MFVCSRFVFEPSMMHPLDDKHNARQDNTPCQYIKHSRGNAHLNLLAFSTGTRVGASRNAKPPVFE